MTKCCICNKVLSDNEGFRMPGGEYRHRECGPGTKGWSKRFGSSDITELLEKSAGTTKRTVSKKSLKEFVGRVKYNAYMDTKNSTSLGWTIINILDDLYSDGVFVYTWVHRDQLCKVQPTDTLLDRLMEAL